MANTWYYEIMGDELGPVSSAELKKLATGNVIDRDTIVRPANGTTRAPAYRLKGLFPDGNGVAIPEATPAVPPMPAVTTTGQVRPSTSTKSKSPLKFDALTISLAGGLAFFALATLALLFFLLTGRTNSTQVASGEQPRVETPSPTPQTVVAETRPTTPETTPEPVVEPTPSPSPDILITEIAKRIGVEAIFVRDIGDITLLVGVEHMRAYVPKNYNYPTTTGTDISFDVRFLTADKSIEEPSAGFIPINGKPEQLMISSSDPKLIEVFDDGSAGVRGAGNAIVVFDLAGTRTSIPIQIRTTPFPIGYGESDSKDVIAALGIPQRKNSHVVRWPHSEIIDQIYYGPDAGSQRVGEHWEYDELPGLAIRVVGSFIDGIGMRDRPSNYVPKVIRP